MLAFPQNVTDFFISYNERDEAWAVWIAWHLEKAGYQCLIQAWDFRPAQDFLYEMGRATDETNRTIAVLSANYFQGQFTQAELNAALAADPLGIKMKLLPVRVVDDFQPTGLLRSRIRIDLVGLDEERAIKKLLAGVRVGRAKPSEAPKFPLYARPSFPGKPTEPPAPQPSSEAKDPTRSVTLRRVLWSVALILSIAPYLTGLQLAGFVLPEVFPSCELKRAAMLLVPPIWGILVFQIELGIQRTFRAVAAALALVAVVVVYLSTRAYSPPTFEVVEERVFAELTPQETVLKVEPDTLKKGAAEGEAGFSDRIFRQAVLVTLEGGNQIRRTEPMTVVYQRSGCRWRFDKLVVD